MDSRTILSCLPHEDRHGRAVLSDTELLSWFTEECAGHEVRASLIPLDAVTGWTRRQAAIEHQEGRYFKVVAVTVEAKSREVTRWTQPLFEPVGTTALAKSVG
ncbi:NDP-hexose 2,3-dehydratase family protein [Nocardiopsis mwathae]|nr:NDP-hexose 2,3-dehydratase family protein [Nocardiopsis mwathae]